MKEFEKRLLEENDELLTRLANLNRFIEGEHFPTLDSDTQLDLRDQQRHMTGYHNALFRRMKRMKII